MSKSVAVTMEEEEETKQNASSSGINETETTTMIASTCSNSPLSKMSSSLENDDDVVAVVTDSVAVAVDSMDNKDNAEASCSSPSCGTAGEDKKKTPTNDRSSSNNSSTGTSVTNSMTVTTNSGLEEASRNSTGLDEATVDVVVEKTKMPHDNQEVKETMTTTPLDALQSLAEIAERELPSRQQEEMETTKGKDDMDMVDLMGVDSMDKEEEKKEEEGEDEKKEEEIEEFFSNITNINSSIYDTRLNGFRHTGSQQAAKETTAKAEADAWAKQQSHENLWNQQQQQPLGGMLGGSAATTTMPFATGINNINTLLGGSVGGSMLLTSSSSQDTMLLLQRQRQVVADLQMRHAMAQQAAAANPTTNILLQLYHQQGAGNHQSYAAFLASLSNSSQQQPPPPNNHAHSVAQVAALQQQQHQQQASSNLLSLNNNQHHHHGKPLLPMDLVEGYFRLPEHQRAKVFPQLPLHQQQQLVQHQQQQRAAAAAATAFTNPQLQQPAAAMPLMTMTTTTRILQPLLLLSQEMVDLFFRLPLLQQHDALVKLPLHQQEQLFMEQQRRAQQTTVAIASANNAMTAATSTWQPPTRHQQVLSKEMMDSFFRLPLRQQNETLQTLPKHQQDQLLLHHCGDATAAAKSLRPSSPQEEATVDLTKQDSNDDDDDNESISNHDDNNSNGNKGRRPKPGAISKQVLAWKKYYEYCVEYKKEFHPNDETFYLPSAYIRPSDGERLGAWAGNQRASYMRKVRDNIGAGQYNISQQRIDKLNDLGFLWTMGGKDKSVKHATINTAANSTYKRSATLRATAAAAQQVEAYEESEDGDSANYESLTIEEWRAREIASGRATNLAAAGLNEDEHYLRLKEENEYYMKQAAGKGKDEAKEENPASSSATDAITTTPPNDDNKKHDKVQPDDSNSSGEAATLQPLIAKKSNNEPKKAALDGASWDAYYTQLAFFKAWKGHLNVPTDYVCEDEYRLQLGKWVTQQRSLLSVYTSRKKRNCGSTPQYIQRRIGKLTELGFEFESRQYSIKDEAKKGLTMAEREERGKHPSSINDDGRAKAVVTETQKDDNDSDTETEDDASTTMSEEESSDKSSDDDDEDKSSTPPASAKKSHKKRRRSSSPASNNENCRTKRPRVRTSWNCYYQLLLAFKKEHGHLRIPTKYEPAPGVRLGGWSQEQRSSYMRKQRVEDGTFVEGPHRKYIISNEKIDKLNQIGFIWDMSGNKGNGFLQPTTTGCGVASPEPLFVEMDL